VHHVGHLPRIIKCSDRVYGVDLPCLKEPKTNSDVR